MSEELAAVPWPWVVAAAVPVGTAFTAIWRELRTTRKELKDARSENTSLLREGFEGDKEQTKVSAEAGAAFTALAETVRLVGEEVRAHKGATDSMRGAVDRMIAVLETFMSKTTETG